MAYQLGGGGQWFQPKPTARTALANRTDFASRGALGGLPGSGGFDPSVDTGAMGDYYRRATGGVGTPAWAAGGGGLPGASGAGGNLENRFQSALLQSLDNPGLDENTIQGMVSKGIEGIAESERDAGMNLRQYAAAMGFADSGSAAGGAQQLASDFSGQKANFDRDTRLDAAKFNAQNRMQSLGLLGDLVARNKAEAAANQERILRGAAANKAHYESSQSAPGMGFGFSTAGINTGGDDGRESARRAQMSGFGSIGAGSRAYAEPGQAGGAGVSASTQGLPGMPGWRQVRGGRQWVGG